MHSPASPDSEERTGGTSRRRLLATAATALGLMGGCAAPSATQGAAVLTVRNAVDRRRDIAVTVTAASGEELLAETLSLDPNEERSVEFTSYARTVSITIETGKISNTVTLDLAGDATRHLAVTVSETETGWQFGG